MITAKERHTIPVESIEELKAKLVELEEQNRTLERQNRNLKSSKRFGLKYEPTVDEKVLEVINSVPVLSYREDKSVEAPVTEGESAATNVDHVLIKGDNFQALTALRATHKGKIDVIYIDPPYNTGNQDFIYNDRFVNKEDGYKHSKWLTFMEKRLRLAKELLSETGVIFVSIDDNEQAYLKVLMDEVFGYGNFVNSVVVKTKTSSGASGGGEDKRLKKNVEYLLYYAKNKDKFSFSPVFSTKNLEEVIQEKENEGKSYEYRSVLLSEGEKELFKTIKDGSGGDIRVYKHKEYTISSVKELMSQENLSRESIYFKYHNKIFRTTNAQTSIRTRVEEITNSYEGLFTIEYTPRSGRSRGRIAVNYYIGNNSDMFAWLRDTSSKSKTSVIKREKVGTLWDDLSWTGTAKEGGVTFNNGKKPISFLKRIISLSSADNPIVLDFFAGSGTTGHAVAELNKEDGGNRQAILVTDSGKNADDPTHADIAEEITYERMRRVLTGQDWADGKEHEPLDGNLRFFDVAHIADVKGQLPSDIQLAAGTYASASDALEHSAFHVVREYGNADDEERWKVFANTAKNVYIVDIIEYGYEEDELRSFVTDLLSQENGTTVVLTGPAAEYVEWAEELLAEDPSVNLAFSTSAENLVKSQAYVARHIMNDHLGS